MFADTLPVDAVWSLLCAMTVAPLGFMLGSSCSPCCGGCRVADGKPRTDPATEGHWVPSGTWASGVTWTFDPNPSTTDGGTWFFYGSQLTSKPGGGASTAEQRDWGNICNWYSNKTTTPSSVSSFTTVLNKRATRLPPSDAIVHIYSTANTSTLGPVTVKNLFCWGLGNILAGSEVSTTDSAIDSPGGAVFINAGGLVAYNFGTINGGATFNGSENYSGTAVVNGGAIFNTYTTASRNRGGEVNGGATFNGSSENYTGVVNDGAIFNDTARTIGTVNGGAIFYDYSENQNTVNGGAAFNGFSKNRGFVNDGATFSDSSENYNGVVNDGAIFNGSSLNTQSGQVNGGAVFNDSSRSFASVVNGGGVFNGTSRNLSSVVNGGATFNGSSKNQGTVNGGATFTDSANNQDTVNGGAVFNGSSENWSLGLVNDGATFNDSACSRRTVGSFLNCPGVNKRIFVAHPTDPPTCNGTAPDGCANANDNCGCG